MKTYSFFYSILIFVIFSCNSSPDNKPEKKLVISDNKTSREWRLFAIKLIDSIYDYSLLESKGLITTTTRDSFIAIKNKEYFKIISTLTPTDTLLLYRYRERKYSEIDKLNNSWKYDSLVNKMGETVKLARVNSTELVYFDFPYSGGSIGVLTIRKKRGDVDIYFTISKGQIDTGIDETYIRVKFDDANPVTYSMSESDDGSSDILFFNNENSLLGKLRKSKRMVVEIPFYQSGVKHFEFDVRNLKW